MSECFCSSFLLLFNLSLQLLNNLLHIIALIFFLFFSLWLLGRVLFLFFTISLLTTLVFHLSHLSFSLLAKNQSIDRLDSLKHLCIDVVHKTGPLSMILQRINPKLAVKVHVYYSFLIGAFFTFRRQSDESLHLLIPNPYYNQVLTLPFTLRCQNWHVDEEAHPAGMHLVF